jgi:hypothetical protein
MTDNPILYRAAKLVIDEIGADAATYATTRADVLQKKGDAMGAEAWRRILPAIERLQQERRDGEAVT